MRALALNATLKPSPETSNTEALARVVLDALEERSVQTEIVRLADLDVPPGVVSEAIRDGDGVPVAYNKVAGFVVTGNEDGAHHCIAEMAGAANDIGFTVPGQGWTYWNKGPGPGEEEYLSSEETDWTNTTARAAAQNLHAVAHALAQHPMAAPPS